MSITFVKGVVGGGQSTSPATASIIGGNTTGNVLVVVSYNRGTTLGVTSVTDTEGNTYVNVANVSDNSAAAPGLHSWWVAPVTNGGTGTNTVSVAFNTSLSSTQIPVAMEFSGVATSSPFDVSAGLSSSNNSTSVSYSITPSAAGRLLISFNSFLPGSLNWSGLSGTDLFGTSFQNQEVNWLVGVSGSNSITATASQQGFGASTVALKQSVFSISGNAGHSAATVNWTGTTSGSTTADGSGNYSTGVVLPAGNYTLTPSLSGFVFTPANSAQTITNANITGVNFTAAANLFVSRAFTGAAICGKATDGSTLAAASWDVPATNFPTPNCLAGTNVNEATLDFASSHSAQFGYQLPSDWSGAIDARLVFFSAATSGSVIFQIATACASEAGTASDDVAFNTADVLSTITLGSPANAQWQTSKTGLNITGCSAGSTLRVKISRADTASAVARVKGLELTIRRSL